MNREIFIFTDCYYPDQVSSGYLLTEIAEKLAYDHLVTVVTTSDESLNLEEFRNKVRIIRVGSSKLDKNKLINRLLRFISICFAFYKIGKKYLKIEHEVICVTNPAFFILFIARLQKKIGFQLSVFVHDVFPENLVATQIISSRNPLYLFLYKIINKGFYNAKVIVTCGRDMQLLFQNKLIGYKGNVEFIPNWGDIELVKPDSSLGLAKLHSLGIQDKLVFQFAGNIGRAQGIPTLLDSIKLLNDEKSSFLFFGNGALVSYLKNNTPNNCIYGGTFSRHESSEYINACDIAIISLEKGMKGLGVPSKTYNILAAGKPILYIGENDSEIAQVIKEHKVGFVCEPNRNSIVEGIKWFHSLDQQTLRSMSIKARSIAENLYSKDIVLEKYSNLYN